MQNYVNSPNTFIAKRCSLLSGCGYGRDPCFHVTSLATWPLGNNYNNFFFITFSGYLHRSSHHSLDTLCELGPTMLPSFLTFLCFSFDLKKRKKKQRLLMLLFVYKNETKHCLKGKNSSILQEKEFQHF